LAKKLLYPAKGRMEMLGAKSGQKMKGRGPKGKAEKEIFGLFRVVKMEKK